MLCEIGISDGYGAAFEYAPATFIAKHNTAQYFSKHPRHKTPPGFYTDDTQMTLAIAEALISREPWTPLNLANRFVEVFKRDPRTGYAGGFYKFLQEITSGKEFLEKINPESDKSGGAMRTTPLGLLETIEEVLEKTVIQAAITHNTLEGKAAAMAASLLVYYCENSLGPIDEAGAWIQSISDKTRKFKIGNNWDVDWKGKVKAKGWMSVRAAITAFSRNTDLTALLIDCVNFRGDVDTVATIALAAASRSDQYDQNLPDVLLYGLENGDYGRDYLIALDHQLDEL